MLRYGHISAISIEVYWTAAARRGIVRCFKKKKRLHDLVNKSHHRFRKDVMPTAFHDIAPWFYRLFYEDRKERFENPLIIFLVVPLLTTIYAQQGNAQPCNKSQRSSFQKTLELLQWVLLPDVLMQSAVWLRSTEAEEILKSR